MNKHPFTLISLWLLSILITMMITSVIVRADLDRIVEVEYIVLTESEYKDQHEPQETIQEPLTLQPIGEYNISAYCPCEKCCGPYADGYTSSGPKAKEGITIAADPEIHPAGTELYIDGIGWRIVQDVGGGIKGNRLDLFFQSHSDAEDFGRQYIEVYQYEDGE